MKYLTYICLALVSIIIFSPADSFAQVGASGIAVSVPIPGDNNPDASIVCSKGSGYQLCDTDYASSMVGVIVDDPSVVFEKANLPDARPLVSSGTVVVRVSGRNGPIKAGDLITSSTTVGVAQKADKNGFVLGTALENFEPPTSDQQGLILAEISIHPTIDLSDSGTNILENLRKGLSFPLLSPLASLRYLLAFAIVVIGFVLGFFYFGRVAKSGIEAIGRNPLASSSIRMGIIFNIMLGIVIVLSSLGIAVLILIL